jgi:hypothetical protein
VWASGADALGSGFKGTAKWAKNVRFKLTNDYAFNNFKLLRRKEVQYTIVFLFYLKNLVSLRGGYCYCSTRIYEHLDTTLTGTFSKLLRQYVSNIPGKHDVKELQKAATLGTAHWLQKVLI